MFSKITNYGGNTYFEYNFGGVPSQFVEVQGVPHAINDARWDLTLGDDRIYRQTVKKWAECVELEHYFSKKDVLNIRKRGIVPEGYSLHHIHPRALGGNTMELKNMVLIPYELHEKLHDFMRDFAIIKCLSPVHFTANVPHGKKIFMQVPVLPPVVRQIDVAFALRPCNFVQDVRNAKLMINAYLKRYPKAFSRPLFVNGVIAKSLEKQSVPVWPPVRTTPIEAHQIHGSSQVATRFQPEHWSFNEWAAAARNRSRNYRT